MQAPYAPKDPSNISGLPTADSLVMAWARHAGTGELRYILEVEATGAKCGCACISCGKPLTAVNAGKREYLRRPHFRHPEGTVKHDCLVLAARAAIAEALREAGTFVLPRRRRSAQVIGLSGASYEAWVEQPRETVRIEYAAFNDALTGILTLDDGRQLEVRLVGSPSTMGDQEGLACVEVVVDDPAIAAMPLDEVRKRLEPLVGEHCWRGHWNDAGLDEQAAGAAAARATEHLDWDSGEGDDLPPGTEPSVRRETLLHRVVKEIIAAAGKIVLPAHAVVAQRDIGGQPVERIHEIPARTAALASVVLERRIGRIVPDIIATEDTGTLLLVEVTVTNPISDERLARIEAEGQAAIEIDIGSTGGQVTRAGLEQLIVHETACKRWLHHPETSVHKLELERLLDADEAARQHQASLPGIEPMAGEEAQDLAASRQRTTVSSSAVNRFLMAAKQRSYYWSIDTANARDLAKHSSELMFTAARALHQHGYSEACERIWYEADGNVLDRLLNIRNDAMNKPGGPKRDLLEDILQDGLAERTWHVLYLIAIKLYAPRMTPTQVRRYEAWRDEVATSLQDQRDPKYRRDTRYDDFIALLFPEMRDALRKSRAARHYR